MSNITNSQQFLGEWKNQPLLSPTDTYTADIDGWEIISKYIYLWKSIDLSLAGNLQVFIRSAQVRGFREDIGISSF